jgi:hypothetical protein
MSIVYHANETTFRSDDVQSWDPKGFTKVAVLNVDSLDESFRLTNHIDEPWWANQEVFWHEESRSTSVGDVVANSEGVFICEMFGWRKLATGGAA